MKTSSLTLLVGAMLFGSLVFVSPIVAQGGQTFRGAAQSMSGSVLTVSGGGETHRFQVSGSTKILSPQGKPTNISAVLNQSVEVAYSGKKEPYRATSVQALEE